MAESSPLSGSSELRNQYVERYRLFCYRGPEAAVEQRDRSHDGDLAGILRSAEALAGDDALWSLAVVPANSGQPTLVWLVGMDYLKAPGTREERFRRQDMEQRFLMNALPRNGR